MSQLSRITTGEKKNHFINIKIVFNITDKKKSTYCVYKG